MNEPNLDKITEAAELPAREFQTYAEIGETFIGYAKTLIDLCSAALKSEGEEYDKALEMILTTTAEASKVYSELQFEIFEKGLSPLDKHAFCNLTGTAFSFVAATQLRVDSKRQKVHIVKSLTLLQTFVDTMANTIKIQESLINETNIVEFLKLIQSGLNRERTNEFDIILDEDLVSSDLNFPVRRKTRNEIKQALIDLLVINTRKHMSVVDKATIHISTNGPRVTFRFEISGAKNEHIQQQPNIEGINQGTTIKTISELSVNDPEIENTDESFAISFTINLDELTDRSSYQPDESKGDTGATLIVDNDAENNTNHADELPNRSSDPPDESKGDTQINFIEESVDTANTSDDNADQDSELNIPSDTQVEKEKQIQLATAFATLLFIFSMLLGTVSNSHEVGNEKPLPEYRITESGLLMAVPSTQIPVSGMGEDGGNRRIELVPVEPDSN